MWELGTRGDVETSEIRTEGAGGGDGHLGGLGVRCGGREETGGSRQGVELCRQVADAGLGAGHAGLPPKQGRRGPSPEAL